MPVISTHSMGVKCQVCDETLVPDNCRCGMPHGCTYQQPNDWAAKTWPEHGCYRA